MAEMAAAEDMAGAELGEITTIQLIANPWNGSAANIAVAAQLLEHIGYEVEVTDLDENAQWAAMNTGDLHASLEVWPSGHADNRADFIDNPDGNVVDAGLLGPIGQIGWFLPAYMVDQYPALATAEGFTDPELAGLFATAETGEAGQILHGDPSWVTFEQDIIDDLGLHLEIVYAGSEEALLAAFDGAFAREEPVLAYFWTPHVAFSTFDLVELELPLDPGQQVLPAGQSVQDRLGWARGGCSRGLDAPTQLQLHDRRPGVDAGRDRGRRQERRGCRSGLDRCQRGHLERLDPVVAERPAD